MDPFEIVVTIANKLQTLLVFPDQEQNKYLVYNGEISYGIVYPEFNSNGAIVWYSDSMITNDLVYQIADKIEKHES